MTLEKMYYASRTYVFSCRFSRLVKAVAKVALANIDGPTTPMMQNFLASYMSQFDISEAKTVSSYDRLIKDGADKSKALRICKKSDVCVFVLQQKRWRECLSSEKTKQEVCLRWVELKQAMQRLASINSPIRDAVRKAFTFMPKSEKVTFNVVKEAVSQLRLASRKWKDDMFYGSSTSSVDVSRCFKEFDEVFQDVANYFEVLELLNKKPVVIAAVSRLGVINLAVALCDEATNILMPSSEYNPVEDNPIVRMGPFMHAKFLRW